MKSISEWWQGEWRDSSLGEILGDEPKQPNIIYPLPRRILIKTSYLWKTKWHILLPVSVAFLGLLIQLFIHFDSKSKGNAEQKETNTKANANHINPISK